jgi:hypothetical protein
LTRLVKRAMAVKTSRGILIGLFGAVIAGQAVSAAVALRISTATAPAGGWAQIKIYAVKPTAVANGHLF